MGTESGPHAGVLDVGDLSIEAQLADATTHCGIRGVGYTGREVMFDLLMQAAHQPRRYRSDDRRAALHVRRRAQLMQGKVITAPRRLGDGERGAIDAVGDLKEDGERETNRP